MNLSDLTVFLLDETLFAHPVINKDERTKSVGVVLKVK